MENSTLSAPPKAAGFPSRAFHLISRVTWYELLAVPVIAVVAAVFWFKEAITETFLDGARTHNLFSGIRHDATRNLGGRFNCDNDYQAQYLSSLQVLAGVSVVCPAGARCIVAVQAPRWSSCLVYPRRVCLIGRHAWRGDLPVPCSGSRFSGSAGWLSWRFAFCLPHSWL